MVKPAIQYSWSRFIKDYWMFLDRRKSKFVFYSGIVSLSFVIPFITAFLLGKIVDFFVDYPQGGNLNLFYIYALSIAFLGAFQVWVRFFGKRGLTTLGADIRKDVRIEAMSKLMDLELKWHDKEDTGSKIQKINKGADDIHNGISYFTDAGIPIFIGIFGGIIAFLAFDLKYLAFALVYISIYLLIEKHFNYKINYWQDRLNKYKERVSGKLHESASNLLTIKSLGLKDSFKDSTSNYEKRAYKIWQKLRDTNHMKFKIAKSFGALGYGLFIVLVGLNVSKGIITIGSIVVFLSYFNKIKSGLDNITNRSSKIINIKSSIGRFMTIFGIEIMDFDKDKDNIPGNWKTIEFRNVIFRYKDKNVLRNFNLKINRGEKIGIVGESGSGKSTLAKLILGLYHPNKGKILIDGKDIKKYKHRSLTDLVGVVLQESEIFNTSLINNVTISSKKKNFRLFENAIKLSQLNPIIKKLPQGVRSILGEKGYHLSGGERQRVGIARAIYKDSPFLILDEATSALDSKTEGLIQGAIKKNLEKKTVLIIAHRLSTLKDVDRIVVVKNGRIIESDNYRGLIKKQGEFYKLRKKQKLE
jgi:ABC-type multidrug transport system fused ATPase/permease subunit